MESIHPVIFDQSLQKISRTSRVSGALCSLAIAIDCIVIAKGGTRLIGWYMFLPVLVFGVIYVISILRSKARLIITRSPKGELHLLVTEQKMILQGVPSSFYNWTHTKQGFMKSSVYLHCMEVKTHYGETLGLISKTEYTDSGGLEIRHGGLSGDYPKYFIADINPLIEVLEANGVQFSYK